MEPTELFRHFSGEAKQGVPEDQIEETEKRIGARLPDSLRALHRDHGHNPRFLEGYHALVRVEDLAREGDHVIFAEEAGGACVWAFVPGRPGLVTQGVPEYDEADDRWDEGAGDEDDDEAPALAWYPEEVSLEVLLRILTATQVAWGAGDDAVYVEAPTDAVLSKLQSEWETLFDYSDLAGYASERRLCLHMEGAPVVQVVAQSRAELEDLVDDGPFTWGEG